MQISSRGAVARSPRFGALSKGPCRPIAEGPLQLHAPGQRHAPHVITITTTAKLTCSVNFSLTGSAHHRSRSEGTLRRFLSPLTHHHHDATVRQHQSARPSPIPHQMRDPTTTTGCPIADGIHATTQATANPPVSDAFRRHGITPPRQSSPAVAQRDPSAFL